MLASDSTTQVYNYCNAVFIYAYHRIFALIAILIVSDQVFTYIHHASVYHRTFALIAIHIMSNQVHLYPQCNFISIAVFIHVYHRIFALIAIQIVSKKVFTYTHHASVYQRIFAPIAILIMSNQVHLYPPRKHFPQNLCNTHNEQ